METAQYEYIEITRFNRTLVELKWLRNLDVKPCELF